MSVTKDLILLAVTQGANGLGAAGIDPVGRWVRPVRPPDPRSGDGTPLPTDLGPLDLVYDGTFHLAPLGITRFWLSEREPAPPYIEDWEVDMTRRPELIRKLSSDEQATFLASFAEEDPAPLYLDRERSLGLYLPGPGFTFSFAWNPEGDDIVVKASFNMKGRRFTDVPVSDLRMRVLGTTLLERSGGFGCWLTEEDFSRRGKEITYLALSLSRQSTDKYSVEVAGVHCLPELQVEIDYKKL